MDREGLADFLRRRRETLEPAQLGLAPGSRRRARGLRREEVAGLAHVSTDFYTRLEQGRGAGPSAQTTRALADALRLDPDERDHLFELTGFAAPPVAEQRAAAPSPELVALAELIDAPAQIVSDLGVTLHQNRLAVALVGEQTHHAGLRASIYYRWFTDPEQRALHPVDEHDVHSRTHVASLRAAHGRARDDPEAQQLIDALLAASDEFAALWSRHEVGTREHLVKRFVTGSVGVIALHCQILRTSHPHEELIVFSAVPGSDEEARLHDLAALAPAVA